MSASNPCGPVIAGCAIRVARLEADGTPDPGAGNLYVSDQFSELTFTVENEPGSEVIVKTACGANGVNFKDCDKLKRVTLTLNLIAPDPELTELLVGGTVLTHAGITRGYALPEPGGACSNGVSIELWAKQLLEGGEEVDPDWPWRRFVFPRSYWVMGQKNFADGAATANPFTGFGISNSSFGNGPANDIPFTFGTATGRPGFDFTDTDLPTAVCGSQTLVVS